MLDNKKFQCDNCLQALSIGTVTLGRDNTLHLTAVCDKCGIVYEVIAAITMISETKPKAGSLEDELIFTQE